MFPHYIGLSRWGDKGVPSCTLSALHVPCPCMFSASALIPWGVPGAEPTMSLLCPCPYPCPCLPGFRDGAGDVGLAQGKCCFCFCSHFPHSHHEQCGGFWVIEHGGTPALICSPLSSAPQAEPSGTARCLRSWHGVWVSCGHEVRGHRAQCSAVILGWVAAWGQGEGSSPWGWQVCDLSLWLVWGSTLGGGVCVPAGLTCTHGSVCTDAPKSAQACECPVPSTTAQ